MYEDVKFMRDEEKQKKRKKLPGISPDYPCLNCYVYYEISINVISSSVHIKRIDSLLYIASLLFLWAKEQRQGWHKFILLFCFLL